MTDAKHTPGPWRLSPKEYHTTGGTLYYKVVSGDFNGIVADVSAWWTDKRTAKCNAALIAAAPDMLAALECAMDCMFSHMLAAGMSENEARSEPFFINALSAISAARGEK